LFFITVSAQYTVKGLLREANISWTEESSPFIYYLVSWNQFIESTLFGLFLGILFIVISEITEKLNWDKLSFGKSLLYKTISYIFGCVGIFFLIFKIMTISGFVGKNVYSNEFINEDFVMLFVIIALYIIFNIIILNFIIQSVLKIGKQNIISFLTGKYQSPVIEDRVFMFLDLKSSTTYAEKLGSIKYSEMLKESFYDINHVASDFEAQIYQYVGDEIVMTWEWENQKFNTKFIDIFFAIKRRLKKREEFYLNKFGTLPVFKAAIHGGPVTVAEIGNIKRDIAFHGDVINTASRIQDLCNTLQESFLISEDLYKRLVFKSHYLFKDWGKHELRGKTQKVGIYGISVQSVINK
jgi:adenylate cyclase